MPDLTQDFLFAPRWLWIVALVVIIFFGIYLIRVKKFRLTKVKVIVPAAEFELSREEEKQKPVADLPRPSQQIGTVSGGQAIGNIGNITGGQFIGTQIVQSAFEVLRIDAAVPEVVYVDKFFSLACKVGWPSFPVLKEEDLILVRSGNAQVLWPRSDQYIKLRVRVDCPECEIDGSNSHPFLVDRVHDSPVIYFYLRAKIIGAISILVIVFQEDNWLGSARVQTTAFKEHVAGAVGMVITSKPIVDSGKIRATGFFEVGGQPEEYLNLRLSQLNDNLRQDLILLKEYEDNLRREDDPRRRARFRFEIGEPPCANIG